MSAPTASWAEVVEASCTGQAHGYKLGWTQGWTAGYQAAQEDAHTHAVNARAARAGVEAVDVVNARQKAAQRARDAAAGWSA